MNDNANKTIYKDLISVIVPVYNCERTLEKCLDSIINQTYSNLEIIIVNDGSIDNSAEICNKYATTDKRITIIHTKNGGPSAARNLGIEIARGKFIGFVDSDDYIEDNMYDYLYANLVNNNAQISICGWFMYVDNEIKRKGYTLNNPLLDGKAAIYYAIRGGYYDGYLWNKLYDATLFVKVKKINKGNKVLDEAIYICEDLLLNCQLFTICNRIFYNPEPLYHYVVYDESILRTYDNIRRVTEMDALNEIINITRNLDHTLMHVAYFKYTQAALTNLKNSYKCKNYDMKKNMREYSNKYIAQSLFLKGVGIKAKLRLFAMYIAPIKSADFWLTLKTKLKIASWTKQSDK